MVQPAQTSPRRLTAICLGGADTLPVDKAGALALFQPDLVIACNHAARDEDGPVDHWATMHPELLSMWAQQRASAGRPAALHLWRPEHRASALNARPIRSWGGSSGLLCVTVALKLECTRIVLAGIPMCQNDCHYDDPRKWREASQYRPAWERHMLDMQGRVRSMSGWTMAKLGIPTAEWLNGDA